MEMIHVKEINAITGYIRGGCSPIGMKKQFPTFLDESAQQFETIYISGGKNRRFNLSFSKCLMSTYPRKICVHMCLKFRLLIFFRIFILFLLFNLLTFCFFIIFEYFS